ncbi:MAG: hypothetical protein K2N29_04925 [Ruminiclostridium sp.]|nr:hypothetical protein [Ruminiclostridium sp.]
MSAGNPAQNAIVLQKLYVSIIAGEPVFVNRDFSQISSILQDLNCYPAKNAENQQKTTKNQRF